MSRMISATSFVTFVTLGALAVALPATQSTNHISSLATRQFDWTGGTGEGTYYTPGLGACGVTSTESDLICAVAKDFFDGYATKGGQSAGANPNNNPICNKKIEVTYQGKSVTVTAVDRCEGCKGYDLDFSPAAFNKLADPSVGRIQGIKWNFVGEGGGSKGGSGGQKGGKGGKNGKGGKEGKYGQHNGNAENSTESTAPNSSSTIPSSSSTNVTDNTSSPTASSPSTPETSTNSSVTTNSAPEDEPKNAATVIQASIQQVEWLFNLLQCRGKNVHPETRPLSDFPPVVNTIIENKITPYYVLGWHIPSRSAFYKHYNVGKHWTDPGGYFRKDILKTWKPEWNEVRPFCIVLSNGGRLVGICFNIPNAPMTLATDPQVLEFAKAILKFDEDPQWFRRDCRRFRGPPVLAEGSTIIRRKDLVALRREKTGTESTDTRIGL
ncbi:DPBB1 domain-containing protein [Stygiomarasmius scandens]|uniref:DPBB1 domain-containing protein n=1 Tax=Marasmiellus scandens TaxID=2682957 RepID=A0ABR1JL17_9AGAR